ncbi:MAG: AsmA family protein [Alphaproteobacteria bacterium]|nr:AsmA family protein [Alphaproteobacteria bacterium]
MKKKIILISLAVVILAVAGTCFYVSIIDWNQHKERIASQISAAIGEKVELTGDLKVSLFPHPKMSAKSVNIINPQNNEKLAAIRRLDTAITLTSLIHGAPDIQSLTLNGVEVWIKFKSSGKSNWHKNNDSEGFGAESELRLQSFNIQNSTVHLESKKYGIKVELENFNAEIHADSLYGPYRLDGNFTKDGDRYGVAFNLDSLSQTEDVNMAFALVHPGSESNLRYDGAYNFSGDTFKGMFSGSSQHTADFVNALLNKKLLEDNFNTPLIFSVEANGGAKKIDLTHFAVTYDTYFEGSGDISLPRSAEDSIEQPADIKYQLVNLDIRPLIELIGARLQRYREGQNYEPDFPYHLNYDVSAVRMIINDRTDGVVENVSAKGSYADGVFSLDDFYAGCAGNTVLSMSGNVSVQNGMPFAVANIVAEGSDFKNFASSLGVELSAPTQAAYKNAKISASLSATPTEIKVDELRAVLDKSEITATGQFAPETQDYQISFKADTLNFDNYVFPLKEEEPKDIISILKHDLVQISKLGEKNINLTAEINAATFRGMNLKNLQTEIDYRNKELAVKYVQIEDFLDTAVRNVTLIIKRTDAEMPEIKAFTYDLKSQDFSVLAQKFQLPLPQWEIFKQKNLATSGSFNGDFRKVNIHSETTLDDSLFIYEGSIEKNDNLWQFDGNVTLKSSRLENLLDKIGFATVENKFYRGVFNGTAHLVGSSNDLEMENINCSLGSAQYEGNLSFIHSEDLRVIGGKIQTNEFNLAQLLKVQNPAKNLSVPSSDNTFLARPKLNKANIDYSWYHNFNLNVELTATKAFYHDYKLNNFSTKIKSTKNALEFQDITFNFAEAEAAGNIKFEYGQTPKVGGTMIFNNLKINNFGGSVYAISGDNVHMENNFETSAVSFEEMLNQLSGTTSLSIGNMKIKGINLMAIDEDLQRRDQSKGLFQVVQDNLKSGSTEFGPIEVNLKIKDGVVELTETKLNNIIILALSRGEINLKDWKMNVKTEVRYTNLPEIDEYSFTLGGAMNRPVLDISIEKIVGKYDAYWQKVAQEEQEQKDAMQKALNADMAEAAEKLNAVADRAAELDSQIEEYLAQNVAEDAEKYAAQKQRIEEIIAEIKKLQSKASQENFTVSDVSEIDGKIPALEEKISDIEKNLKRDVSVDIKQKMQKIRDNTTDVYTQTQTLLKEYRQMLDDDIRQLAEINSASYITDNAGIKNWQSTMDGYAETVEKMYGDFNKNYDALQKVSDESAKMEKINELSAVSAQLENLLEQMKNTRSATAKTLLAIVDKRQEEYRRESEAAEKKRLAEEKEDAENLLIVKEKKAEDKPEAKQPEVKKTILKPQVEVKEETPKAVVETKPEVKSDAKPETKETAETPEKIKEIIHTDLPDVIEDPDSIPEAIEVPVGKISGGTILRTYEEPETEIFEKPVKKLLKPTSGAVQKPSGTIFVP